MEMVSVSSVRRRRSGSGKTARRRSTCGRKCFYIYEPLAASEILNPRFLTPMATKRKPEAEPELPEPEKDPEEDEEADDDDEEEASEESGEESGEESSEAEGDQVNTAAAADDSTPESLKNLLESLGMDQLIQILKRVALKYPAFIARITAAAESDLAHRKLFVHGLSYDTTTETLSAAFAPFGEIEECRAVFDDVTGHCKGFGFVLFRTRAGASAALKDHQKQIGGRTTNCQLASFGALVQHAAPKGTGRKIFVSGVGESVSQERLRGFFSQFGEIEDGPLGYDRATGKLRGFAIFVYKTVEGCQKALEEPDKVFEGCKLQCQRALEGLKQKTPFQGPAAAAPQLQAAVQPNDLASAYTMFGRNPAGLVGQNFNPAMAGMSGQNAELGMMNPATGMVPSMGGATQSPYGIGLGGGGAAVNYGNPMTLQGSGARQDGRLSSMPGNGSVGTGLPPYYGR